MKLLDRLKFAFTNSMDDYISAFLRGDDIQTTGTNVTTETALKYSAVFACVRVLSETLASMPIKIYKRDKNGNKELVSDLNLYRVLHNRPNEEMSPFSYKEASMMALCLHGNAFAYKIKNRLGEVVGLYPIDPGIVQIDRDKSTNRLIYKVKNGTETKTYTRDEIFHIPGLSLDGISGLTPVGYVEKAIELGLTYENFGVNFYKNGANPSGILEHPGVLKADALERLREQFAKKFVGLANSGKPLILEEGMKYSQLTVKQSDAQFLESRKFQIQDIARIYRVPLHLIQDLDRSTNNNIEHQSLEFVKFTMLPWFQRWEEAINAQLLTESEIRQGYFAEFLVESLLRGDIKTRYEAYSIARNWGWMSVNEIRKLENLNQIEYGDIYLQPLNMVEAGEEPEDDPEDAIEDDQEEGGTKEIEKILEPKKSE